MKKLLTALGVNEFDEVKWFLDKPIAVEWWKTERFEANYDEIAGVLSKIETARKDDEGDIRSIITQAMEKLADDVDTAIGIF